MPPLRRLQAGVHATLIGFVIPFIWLNLGLLTTAFSDEEITTAGSTLAAVGWVLIFAVVLYMSKRDGADPFAFDWKDRIPLACAFAHGTACNLVLRQGEGHGTLVVVSLVCTASFGILCVCAIVIDLVRRHGDDDDPVAGLVLDGGEEGGISLNESPRVPWPTYFDSARLRLYRKAGAAALFGVVSTGWVGGVTGIVAVVVFCFVVVPLCQVVRGPWGGSGSNRYYSLAMKMLGAANAWLLLAPVIAAIEHLASGSFRVPWQAVLFLPAVLLPPGLLFMVLRYDKAHPDEDAEGAPELSDDVEAAVLFDPDAEEIH